MNLQETTSLHAAMSLKDLKAKHVTGENYLKIIRLKKQLKDALSNQSELEKEVFDGLNVFANDELMWDADTKKQVWDKLTPLRKQFDFKDFEPFLNTDEFKEWTKEHDVAMVSVLAEYLLKDFTAK